MALNYHYSRIMLSLARLGIVALLEKYGFTLEDLSKDLTDLLRETTQRPLMEAAMFIDYLNILEETPDAMVEESRLFEEIRLLIKEVSAAADGKENVRGIHLEFPNVLIIETTGDVEGPMETAPPKKFTTQKGQP